MLLRWLATLAVGLSLSACGGSSSGGGGGGGNTGPFTLGGAVSGLAAGASVVLVNNGGNALTVNSSGAFAFSTALASGSAYAVTVQTQPTDQTCTVTSGSGTATANVSNVAVACVTNAVSTFTIGGSVSGLTSGASVVLRNNSGNDLTVAANGAFTFTTAVATGGAYAATVLTQPTGQTCTVANGSGTVASANVTNVAVTCAINITPTFTVGGAVSGLAGTGLVLRNNGGNNLAVAANGAFTFTTAIATGGAYAVTVLTQPVGQTCVVASGSGTIASANVTDVAVTCVTNGPPTFTIGGTVSGLAGTGLVLRNSGGNALTVSANGAFTFTAAITSGTTYAVTVLTQPSAPTQSCVVTSGTGTVASANINNVTVTCTTTHFTVGGTVSGLAGTGLVLRNNGGNNLAISADGAFSFTTQLTNGANYAVTVLTQPSSPTQSCVVTSGTGTVASANINNVTVTCTTTHFTVGGTVSGLAGTGLVLRNNGGNNLAISADGAFSFTTQLTNGANYAVTVLTQPSSPTQSCVVTSGTGTVASANINNVVVTCTSQYTVGGAVSGLAGTGLVLRNNGGSNLVVAANGAFTFPTLIANGTTYAVTVLTQPSSVTQSCVVTDGTGTVTSANITNVAVTCTTSEFTLGGTISGLTGTGLELSNSGGTPLALAAGATSFSFPATVLSGAAYAVTVSQQPADQSCRVSSGSGTGTVTSANVTNVSIGCSAGGGSGYAFISNEKGTRRVASYSVGVDGGFTQVSAVALGVPATGVAVTPSGNHVIVAVDPSNSADGELHVFSASSTGQLTFASMVVMGPGVGGYSHTVGCGPKPGTSGQISCGIGINSAPETVLIHPNGQFVYVMDGVAGGACAPLDPAVPVVGPCTPANGGFPAAGNRVIVRYTFDPATGTLTYHDQHYVEGFMSFAMDPQGRFVWGTSYLERRIYEFRIDQSSGALTFGTGTYIGMSNGAMSLGIDPNGNYAYAAHEGDRTIDAYTINQTTGHLTNIGAINGSCGAPANCNKVSNVLVRGLAVGANGGTLYGASGSVLAYTLGADGSIGAALGTYAPAVPVSGGGTRHVAIGSAGKYLYLQGYDDPTTRVFSINPSTGVLTESPDSPTSLVGGTSGVTALSLR